MSNIITNRVIGPAYNYDSTALQFTGNWSNPTFTITLVNGSTPPIQGAVIGVNYLISATDQSANLSTATLISGSIRQVIVADGTASSTVVRTILPWSGDTWDDESSANLVLSGGYLCVWLDNDILHSTISVSIAASVSSSGGSGSGPIQLFDPGLGRNVTLASNKGILSVS